MFGNSREGAVDVGWGCRMGWWGRQHRHMFLTGPLEPEQLPRGREARMVRGRFVRMQREQWVQEYLKSTAPEAPGSGPRKPEVSEFTGFLG